MPSEIDIIKQRVFSHRPMVLYDASPVRACVLVPLVQRNGSLQLLLTKRTDRVEHHKGQISFPGGLVEHTDKSPQHTALRELEEELGIPASSVEIFGTMSDVQIPSGFIVTPVVGYIGQLNGFKISNDEVEEVILIPFEKFFDDTLRSLKTRKLKGRYRTVYFYDVWKEPVWGATAFIIKQLTDIITA